MSFETSLLFEILDTEQSPPQTQANEVRCKGKGKGHPRTGHEGPEGE